MNFEIKPHVGIGSVELEMNRADIKKILGEENLSYVNEEIDYYFNNSLQIEFVNDKADFIGMSYHPDINVMYKNTNVFDTEAKELFNLIARNEEENHKFDEMEYLFPKQIVTLWDADEQYDHMGTTNTRLIWAQIGIGSQNYLEAVS